MSFFTNIHKTLNYFRRNGAAETFYAAAERLAEKAADRSYTYVPPEQEVLRSQRAIWECLNQGATPEEVFGPEFAGRVMPRISILVPAYETEESYLRALLDSVTAQSYGSWELILADASMSDSVRRVASEYEDARIHYHRLSANGGISRNTNAAAVFAQGDYIALLDHDDFLTPDALFEAAMGILKTDCEILYSDEDKCDESGERYFERNRKPDFNYDYFLCNNYICHLLVMKRGLFLALRLRSEYDGAQDYDLLLRAPHTNVCHVAKVLYHWRTHAGSTAGDPCGKDYAAEAGRAALADYFRSAGIRALVRHSRHRGFYDVSYEPDIFAARTDVGIVGGKVVNRRRRIVGGMFDSDGRVMFEGMHEKWSGPMHRADTRQNAAAVDVRCMRIRPELQGLYREVFGSDYDAHIMDDGRDYRRESIEFCRRAAALGYVTVWEPSMVTRLEK
ncbi:glycosyltransferase [Lachnoclostridium sp. Marseille-P6806]|uniref:glycosyltransferase n=1 Tax=Lachnoclostridium sp. Marseille-P6806 TaxID=2364793 RepID=UPI0013EF4932|nr:glycosyltransferase [Lachnoclostridium sp. Marseille-P6806]